MSVEPVCPVNPKIVPVLILLLIPPGAALHLLGTPLPVYIGLVVVSLITAALVGLDKSLARTGETRVPESLLHFLELCGGWPGSFLAQQIRRHKTAKKSYQFFFWMIVLLHQAAALAIVFDALEQ